MSKKRKKKKRFSVPLFAAFLICVAVLGVSVWKLTGIYLEYKRGTDEYDALLRFVSSEIPDLEEGSAASGEGRSQRVAFDELRALNEDIIGWIEIPDTKINYPIVKGDDDAYYLNHTFSGAVNSAGSIFLEVLNRSDFTDLHTLIYGHNMKNGSMFGSLKEYKAPSYLVDHPRVYIDLEDGTHVYEIFSCYETSSNSDSYTIGFLPDEEYAAFLKKLKSRSAYDTGVEVTMEDSIITLSTCSKSGTKRFLVHAKKIS